MSIYRSRGFCFTINNDTYADFDLMFDSMPYAYLCFGFEVAPSTNTEHIQGYCYFDNAHTMQVVKRWLPRAHIEYAKGTSAQNKIYTSKLEGDNWYEFGEAPQQGRAKWDQIVETMKNPQENPHLYNQYNKMYRSLTLGTQKKHDRKVCIIHYSHKYKCGFDTTFFYNPDNGWDTYDGEQAVVISNYSSYHMIEQWFHDYPPKVKRGYELICIDPEWMVITYDDEKEIKAIEKKYNDKLYGIWKAWEEKIQTKEHIKAEDESGQGVG